MRGSLRRNPTSHHPDTTDNERETVIDLCGLPDLLDDLDNGFEAPAEEGGTNQSSGQRQRSLLGRAVRALTRQPLLDEARCQPRSRNHRNPRHQPRPYPKAPR